MAVVPHYVIQIKTKNQVDPTQFIITNRVRCSTKYLGAPSVYSTINQVDRTQLVSFVYPNYAMMWMTTVNREIQTKNFDVQTQHTRVKLSESFVMFTYRTQL